MKKLMQITEYLLELNMVSAEQLDSWAENIRFVADGTNLGQGFRLIRVQYDAVIVIERFPFHRHDPMLLFAQTVAWLINNDADRKDFALDEPDTDVDILDNSLADIDLRIPFIEFVEIVPDEAGEIELSGVNYRLATVPINYAQSGEVEPDDS